jgi:predicted alpha/beta-fold hydrolase
VAALKHREPDTDIAVIGYSLGGNVLLKWLGEQRHRAPIRAAAAVSVPFMLADSATRMAHGFSRVYQWELVQRLKRSVENKRRRLALSSKIDDLSRIATFREFDEHVTAPLHGFAGADDYYARASSRPFLKHIDIPTLIVHSRDDPFMSPQTAPLPNEVSAAVTLEIFQYGGHVGFVGGPWPWRADYWLERRIPAFFAETMKAR